MSQQPRKINTNHARQSGAAQQSSGRRVNTAAARTQHTSTQHSGQQYSNAAHSGQRRTGTAGTAHTAARRKKKRSRIRWWMPLLVVLALIGGAAAYVLNYLDSVVQEIKPESGTAQMAEEVKTAPEYAGDVVGVLICGIDYTGGEAATADGTNDGMTDMILYFQFDVKNKQVNMLQIPRNTYVGATITCTNTTGKTYKASNGQINSIMKSNRSENGSGSVAALADVVANNYCLPIDYYGTINMDALKTLVTVFGGVEVYVPQTIEYKGSRIEEGYHTLNADECEFLLRNRKTYADSDISRLNMQRQFYAGLFRRIRTASVAEIIKLVPYVVCYIETDCDATTLISLALSFLKVDSANIMICQAPVYNGSEYFNGNSVVVAARDDTANLLNTYFRSYTGEVPAERLGVADWAHGSTATSPNVQYMGQLDQQASQAIAEGNTTVDPNTALAG